MPPSAEVSCCNPRACWPPRRLGVAGLAAQAVKPVRLLVGFRPVAAPT
jgi:hypothetical protein